MWEKASGHPNILPIIEADEYEGQIVIVSEYAPGGSLEDLLQKEGKLATHRAIELIDGILCGLEFLHKRKIIHRDIKPANILLQGDTPRLADFGISRVMKTTSVSINFGGTPVYMAPEAFDRKRTMQTDIWSVGVILYQMLSGSLPYPFQDMTELIGAIVLKNPEPLPEIVPACLQEIVFKALAKTPDRRYQNAREMRDDLVDFLAGISQQDFQQTLSPEGLPPTIFPQGLEATFYRDALVQTQISPTILIPVADTAGNKIAETQASNEFLELPIIESSRPKSVFSFKIIAGVGLTLLSIISGIGIYLYFTNYQTSAANTSSKQPLKITTINYEKSLLQQSSTVICSFTPTSGEFQRCDVSAHEGENDKSGMPVSKGFLGVSLMKDNGQTKSAQISADDVIPLSERDRSMPVAAGDIVIVPAKEINDWRANYLDYFIAGRVISTEKQNNLTIKVTYKSLLAPAREGMFDNSEYKVPGETNVYQTSEWYLPSQSLAEKMKELLE